MDFSSRKFRLWEFRVSHDQLLIRSVRSQQHPRNVDIIFEGVDYIELPTKPGDIAIDKPTREDVLHVHTSFRDDIDEKDIYVIVAQGRRFFVVAAGMRTIENELEFYESSLEQFP